MTLKLHPNGLDALTAVICGEGGHPEDGCSQSLPYRTKRSIELFFRDLGLEVVSDPSRWPTARNSLSLANRNERKIIKVIEALLLPANYAGLPNPYEAIELIQPHLEAVGWTITQHKTYVSVHPMRGVGLSHIDDAIIEAANGRIELLTEDLAKARRRAQDDPTGAVTLACSILETTCKFIIRDNGGQLPKKTSIDPLFKEAVRLLKLTASTSDTKDVIRDDVYRVFSGLDSIVKGIGALRTHGSDSHGGNFRAKIDSRIAKLALDSASTVTMFLLETNKQRQGINH